MTERNSRASRGSLLAASQHGTDLELLRRLRDKIAARLDDPNLPARDFAPMSRRLTETIRAIVEAEKPDPLIPGEPAPDEPFDASAI